MGQFGEDDETGSKASNSEMGTGRFTGAGLTGSLGGTLHFRKSGTAGYSPS